MTYIIIAFCALFGAQIIAAAWCAHRKPHVHPNPWRRA
jgi:hypothetical protein